MRRQVMEGEAGWFVQSPQDPTMLGPEAEARVAGDGRVGHREARQGCSFASVHGPLSPSINPIHSLQFIMQTAADARQ